MKRVLLFFVLLVMVSGCSINYNIKIEDGSIRDSLELNISNSEYRNYASSVKDEPIDSDMFEYFKDIQVPNFKQIPDEFHKKDVTRLSDGAYIKYSYDGYTYNNFNSSYLLNNCFEKYSVVNKDDYYYINAGGKFLCYYDTTYINIKTDKAVLYTTADYKNGSYVYEINKFNYDDVNFVFQIDKSEPFIEEEVIDVEKTDNELFGFNIVNLIWIIILTGALVALIMLSKRFK